MDFFISNAYAQSAAGPSPIGMLFPIILMFGVMYFLMIRPQQKRMKEHRSMVEALGKGDEVVTNGGLGGTVTKVGESFVTIRVADEVEVNVQKQSVASLLPSGTLKSI